MIVGIGADVAERKRLVLWRHGRTEWNAVGRAQGHAEVPLDAVGVAQAERAAVMLATYQPAFVWSSDLARARETAERLVKVTGNELVLDPRLREYDVGARQGMTFAEFGDAFPALYAAYMAGGDDVAIPGAETTRDVCARMIAVLDEAADALSVGETGVVVGHGASLRSGLLAWFNAPPHLLDMFGGLANCAWAMLENRGGRGWQIVDYNAHNLPEPLPLVDEPHA
jgi:probable phosphoglycerate mutase